MNNIQVNFMSILMLQEKKDDPVSGCSQHFDNQRGKIRFFANLNLT